MNERPPSGEFEQAIFQVLAFSLHFIASSNLGGVNITLVARQAQELGLKQISRNALESVPLRNQRKH